MEFKIYQDREKIADTGDINRDYRVLFPQTTTEAVHYKNDFTDNNLKSALDYLVDTKSCVIVSEDKPTNTVGDTHWMKILGTYNNGTIGNIYLTYVLNHNLRNHDGTVVLNQTENVICKNGDIVTPTTKDYDGYLPETQSKVEISENGQIIDCYYDEEQYNVSYVLNGGTNNSSNPSTVWYTDDITLKNATKSDSTFAGWYLDSGFTTKISKLNKISKDITLYAKFTEKQYGITYVLNGGTNASSNPSVITQADTVTLENATKSGSTFEGWYSDSSFTTKVTVLSGITSDITLYAKFSSTSSGGDSGSGSGGSSSGSSDANKVYLYKNGDENVAVTGGWNGYVLNNESVGSFKKEATYMELKTTNGAITSSSCSIGVKTANNVLGSHTKVCVKYTLSGNAEAYTNRDGFTDMNYFAVSSTQATHTDTYPVGNDMVGSLEIYARVPYTEKDAVSFTIPDATLRIYEVWLENDDTGEDETGRTYLYDYGVTSSIAGGWTLYNDSDSDANAIVKENSDHLYFNIKYDSNHHHIRMTTNKSINFSTYNKVCFKYSYAGVSNVDATIYDGAAPIEIGTQKTVEYTGSTNYFRSFYVNANEENSIYSKPVGSATGSGHLYISLHTWFTSDLNTNKDMTLKIHQIWLE